MLLLALAAGLPAAVAGTLILLWTGGSLAKMQWTLTRGDRAWFGGAARRRVRERVASPLRTLANLLEAMREGDYSIRAARALATKTPWAT